MNRREITTARYIVEMIYLHTGRSHAAGTSYRTNAEAGAYRVECEAANAARRGEIGFSIRKFFISRYMLRWCGPGHYRSDLYVIADRDGKPDARGVSPKVFGPATNDECDAWLDTPERVVTTEYATATYTGRGEFYSGIGTGERVTLQRITTEYDYNGERHTSISLYVQSLDDPGAWLGVQRTASELTDVGEFGPHPPFEYGYNLTGRGAPAIVGIASSVEATQMIRKVATARLQPREAGAELTYDLSYRRLDAGGSDGWRVMYRVTVRRYADSVYAYTNRAPEWQKSASVTGMQTDDSPKGV